VNWLEVLQRVEPTDGERNDMVELELLGVYVLAAYAARAVVQLENNKRRDELEVARPTSPGARPRVNTRYG
jgi:hypothetical protein